MRKLFIFLGILLFLQYGHAQSTKTVITENFDNATFSFTSSPNRAWKTDTSLYLSFPNAYRGQLPNMIGDTSELLTPVYDFTNYGYVFLHFSHICKISPDDIARVEYRINMGAGVMSGWKVLPSQYYDGNANNYAGNNFSANSYSEWQGYNNLTSPAQSWWKEEVFELTAIAGHANGIQFRFFLKHGMKQGTQVAYGWLIDNVEITASKYQLYVPAVRFTGSYPAGSVPTSGPYTINATVKTNTNAPIQSPWLLYTATFNNASLTDSVAMQHIAGDSLWKATLPQFEAGTAVEYAITGRDTVNNTASVSSSYLITKPVHAYGNYSIALTAINSPQWGQTTGNVSTPLNVTIRNKGDSILRNADISWTVNNGQVNTFHWTGNLLWDFQAQLDTIGTYIPTPDAFDTVRIWVSLPNGTTDVNTSDDTLTVIPWGCMGNMQGNYTVGPNGRFGSVSEALNFFKSFCTPAGDITLLLEDTIYTENWIIGNVSDFMGNHTLTITSLSGNRDNVVLRPPASPAAPAITLSGASNLKIENITIDVDSSGTYGIQFTSACTNVVINHCRILGRIMGSTLNAAYAPISKENGTGIANTVSITNNTLNGGYHGINFSGGTTSMLGTDILISHNEIIGTYYTGINSANADFSALSNNRIASKSGTTGIGGTWYGINLSNCNGDLIGNRIQQKSTNISQPRGIYVYNFNLNRAKDTSLIANNEVILNATAMASTINPGIHISGTVRAKVLHNSIYISGAGNARGIQIDDNASNYIVIKNNNIIMESASAFPVYLSAITNLRLYDMDYNNMYARNYVGYAAGNKAKITDWQATIATDRHSISQRPAFIDSTINLELINYDQLCCFMEEELTSDIENTPRTQSTTMGCYHGYVYPVNAALVSIIGYREGLLSGQKDSIKVIITNTRNTTLTQINIDWIFNGSRKGVSYTGTLQAGKTDTTVLGEITYSDGRYDIEAYITGLGTLQDFYPQDDTLRVSGMTFSSAFQGHYTVGDTGYFASISEAVTNMQRCGVSGDIVLELLPGIHPPVDLRDNTAWMRNHSFTLTSHTGDASDATIETTASNTTGIYFNNSRNITIDGITITAKQGTAPSGILFGANTCADITVTNCIILTDTLSSSSYPIYREDNAANTINNISITDNYMEGGLSGIRLFAGSMNPSTYMYTNGTNLVIENNIICKQHSYGIYCSYADLDISANTLTSRTTNTSINTQWYGLYLSYCNGSVTANRIKQQNIAITDPYGIYVMNFNRNITTNIPLIANNEIMLNAIPSWYNPSGIYAGSQTRAKILHNSIYVSGTGAPRGIDIVDNFNNIIAIKNNSIIMDAVNANPLYLSSTNNLHLYDIDYNNLFPSISAGYAGLHSVTVRPGFIDSTLNLKLLNYNGLLCPVEKEVPSDMDNLMRTGRTTAMGCYGITRMVNATLLDITGYREGLCLGEKDSLRAVILNTGTTPLSVINMDCLFGGTVYSISKPVSMQQGETDTVTLGEIVYTAGDYVLEVFISSLGSLQDQEPYDDTLRVSGYVCSSMLQAGIYSVGSGGSFSNMQEAEKVMQVCGISGDIVLEFLPGTYPSIDLRNSSWMGNHTLTLTSATGNASDVLIESNAAGIYLGNSSNIIIRKITIDVDSNGTYGIQFTDACSNIIIDSCRILGRTVATTETTAYAPFYKANNTGIADNISIINNIIDGGYYGIYFYGGTGDAAYGTTIAIDNNIISNQAKTAVSCFYTDFSTLSGNRITSRDTNILDNWCGINLNSCNGDITCNRIIQQTVSIKMPYGIQLSNFNYSNAGDTSLIANNEIILSINPPYSFNNSSAIQVNNSKAGILHNSIYVTGTGTARGIEITSYSPDYIMLQNNNIVMESTEAYPVYLGVSPSNISLYKIDYNNMFAPTYVGYAGENKTDMPAWKQTVTSDSNSVKILPTYINSAVSLELVDGSDLFCPVYSGVNQDIRGYYRSATTIMGAYITEPVSFDLSMEKIICEETDVLYSQPVSIKIAVINLGTQTGIDSAIFGWSVNGVVQPSYRWVASNPLNTEEIAEIMIGSFDVKTNLSNITVWIEQVNGGRDSIPWNDTIKQAVNLWCTGYNLTAMSAEVSVVEGACLSNYVPVRMTWANTGTMDYNFAENPVTLSVEVTRPIPFYKDTILTTGSLASGAVMTVELTDMLPVIVSGQYDVQTWISSPEDVFSHDDSLLRYYISGRFGLPVDEGFDSLKLPEVFFTKDTIHSNWKVVPCGTGTDTVVKPQQGDGMLAFSGIQGSMSTLSTYQLDLSRAIQPVLSFWYFHDTIPCDDYTDVRITVDGGNTYTPLFSLTRYNTDYGWKQYDTVLPAFAINQCVALAFEAMEKSPGGNVTQYIDHILITAKQEIAITDIFVPEFSVCNLDNKEWKVVLSNSTAPDLDYSKTPVEITLELPETSHTFVETISSGILEGFSSDTISIASGFNLAPGKYIAKANISSVFGEVFIDTIDINPKFEIEIEKLSGTKQATAEFENFQKVTIKNTGNMELSDIGLILSITSDDGAYTFNAKDTFNRALQPNGTAVFIFDSAYIVPWSRNYDVKVHGYLICDSILFNKDFHAQEEVDINDLYIVNITNPLNNTIDTVNSLVEVSVSVKNRSLGTSPYNNVEISLLLTDTNSNSIGDLISEYLPSVNGGQEVAFTFNESYRVPEMTKYHLTVYIKKVNDYVHNDTLTIVRETTSDVRTLERVGVSFAMEQNIPNPAKGNTIINYRIPQDGEIIFRIYSVSGQILYNKVENVSLGEHQIELNLSDYASGVYFYTMEYKGQRISKRMSVN